MNIFYLNQDPDICAEMHCDKHVVKMCCEYAQLLSTTHRVVDGHLWVGKNHNGRKLSRYFLEDGEMNSVLYKACHVNHPSTKWVRESASNYHWLYDMWLNLCDEYHYRYNKRHKSQQDLEYHLILPPTNINTKRSFREPPPAMKQFPQCIVNNDAVMSYHNYYWEAKKDFAKWTKRNKPEWWNERERIETETQTSVSE